MASTAHQLQGTAPQAAHLEDIPLFVVGDLMPRDCLRDHQQWIIVPVIMSGSFHLLIPLTVSQVIEILKVVGNVLALSIRIGGSNVCMPLVVAAARW
eukprot:CAMPEP_0178438368 /NCGR_PEP_ID=MMETSP0689_2-20121128/35555_1 /TAXON_ID=160604 /ORGANISM="Amphidinium massartii, Strain CS-259" /LENGTH=96 /DNA_ID=CAMNT_0020060765 /DNA_START=471 /DNA_END=759 /DNA_ORIENTATION=-